MFSTALCSKNSIIHLSMQWRERERERERESIVITVQSDKHIGAALRIHVQIPMDVSQVRT